jgi:hypothetical protein
MAINHDELEDWALRTMQTLQEVCDDAQVAAGNPDGEDQCQDIRALMDEYERIMQGLPAWQAKVNAMPCDEPEFLSKL